MSRKQGRPIRKKDLAKREAGVGGERPRPAGRAPRRNPRRMRQLIAVGSVVVVLIAVAIFVIATQSNQPTDVALAPDRHAKGSPQAAVTITDWSDFQ